MVESGFGLGPESRKDAVDDLSKAHSEWQRQDQPWAFLKTLEDSFLKVY